MNADEGSQGDLAALLRWVVRSTQPRYYADFRRMPSRGGGAPVEMGTDGRAVREQFQSFVERHREEQLANLGIRVVAYSKSEHERFDG